jgi:hypothetical protein
VTPYVEALPFSYMSVAYMPRRSECIWGYFTHQDWQRSYVWEGYLVDDPLFNAACMQVQSAILWSSVPQKTKRAVHIMRAREEVTGVSSGISKSFQGEWGRLVLAVGDPCGELDFIDKYERHYGVLTALVENIASMRNSLCAHP